MRIIDTLIKRKATAAPYYEIEGVQPPCLRPFQHLMTSIEFSGITARTCCSSWLSPKGVDEIRVPLNLNDENSLASSWKAEPFEKLRRALLQGDLSFCRSDCPSLVNKWSAPNPGDLPILSLRPPGQIDHAIDRSCNLQCPSCRDHIIGEANPLSIPALKAIFNTHTPHLFMNGSGEFFINRSLLNYFATFTKEAAPFLEEITIITNGNAFTLDKWYALSHDTRDLVKTVSVSIDAALPETYHVIRKGGNFFKVLEVIKELKKLLDKGEISRVGANMVIQRGNYQEVEDFADMFISLGVTELNFAKIADWGEETKCGDSMLTPLQEKIASEAITRIRAKYPSKDYRIFSNL